MTAVLLNIDDRGVATVTLNNPEKHNAFDDAIIAELDSLFAQLAERDDVRIVVLAAEGRSFSAGADLNWMQRMASYSYEENLRDAHALAEMLRKLNTLPQPTIARVQGAAFGGAVGLISCCDMAVAASRASFSLSEVKIGLLPATISPYVIDAIGARAARRLFTTAERFSAKAARRLGLVSKVVDEEDLKKELDQLIDNLLTNSPQAVRAAKQLVFDVAGKPLTAELIEHTCEQIAAIRVSEEGQEGLQAFLQKRKPNWINDEQ
ncbi:enoyl-CoA hydratase/isomerase family protein [Porticoccus sp. W117]|uniref:enoyl-CoA hydratase/isomerase family protein n=1 Tax=Porticoccus sp. W117 TaxID=3054777 RepID=UPI00259765AB|nr:enoyl-CoA hydratase/isomerase family protein [Porticoccus sp. W117]MDM3871349.1 enoyl-CoA hydratase/isomerase family protein [Porticoccus sp. W117]